MKAKNIFRLLGIVLVSFVAVSCDNGTGLEKTGKLNEAGFSVNVEDMASRTVMAENWQKEKLYYTLIGEISEDDVKKCFIDNNNYYGDPMLYFEDYFPGTIKWAHDSWSGYRVPVFAGYLYESLTSEKICRLDDNGKEIRLLLGDWNFTLYATSFAYGGLSFINGTDGEVSAPEISDLFIGNQMYSGNASATIVSGINSLSFFLEEVENGYGAIDITINCPKDYASSAVAILTSLQTDKEIDDFPGFCTPKSDGVFNYINPTVPYGNYLLSIVFYDSIGNVLQPKYTEVVQVRAGRISRKTSKIESFNREHKIMYAGIELSDDLPKSFTEYENFALPMGITSDGGDKIAGWYIKVGGDAYSEEPVTSIPLGTLEDVTVKPKWKHVFSADWSSDGSYHWHAATCDHGDQRDSEGGHEFGEAYEDEGVWKIKCRICGYWTDATNHPGA